MKLYFIIKALEDIHGGAERVLADITYGLADKGHQVFVISFDRAGAKPFYQLHKDVTHICLGIGNTQRQAKLFETLKRMKALRSRILLDKPDYVVPFMHSSFIPTAFALIGAHIPVIASEHIVPQHYKSRKFEFLLFLLSSFFIKKITVLSESIKGSYPAIIRKKMVSIENPVLEVKKFAATSRKNKDGRFTILNVGRLDYQKDQELLITAFSNLSDKHKDWDLRIIGEGELRNSLENLIESLNLQDRVFLPGTTSDISSKYQSAHIFALPSRYESFGLATAEAMAHGLPVIGFADCPGTNELISNNVNGILVNTSSRTQGFEEALEKLIQSPVLRQEMGENAIKSMKRFDKDTVVKKWEAIFTD